MSRRLRKKWLKKHGLYVNPKETWCLDDNIVDYILPRLKLFKKLNNGYPGKEDMDTPERWNEALDIMIAGFEATKRLNNLDDKYWDETNTTRSVVGEFREEVWKKDQEIEKEGWDLFAKWHANLWW